MNVLHVIPSIAARYGGPSQAIRLMCGALSAYPGMNVAIATTDADGAKGRINSSEIPQGLSIEIFRRTFSERWKYSKQLADWLDKHVINFDLVHIHGLWSHAPYAAAKAARRAKVPYIIRPAGMLSQYSLGHRAIIKRISWWLAEKSIVNGASAFHATTAAEAADIRAIVPTAKVSVIPNGVDEAAFTISRDRESLRHEIFEDRPPRPIVLFLSRLHPKKGVVDLLLPAIAGISPRPLLILAGGADDHDPGYSELIKQTVESLGIQKDVILWGNVTGNERWRLFDAADVFVLPSHSENFGIVVAEAMARGCPVLLTDQVQIQDELLEEQAAVVVPCRVDAIRFELERFMNHPDAWASLGSKGKNYSFDRFRWSSIAGQLVRMYQSTVDRGQA